MFALQSKGHLGTPQNDISVQEINYSLLYCRRSIVANNGGSDDRVAAIVEGNHQSGFPVWRSAANRIGPAAALHPRDGNRPARAIG